ncbi:PepSY-associated TM helix domain-containing protein [Shewanella sp. Isolate11]|uniref:PepSY-associated TM helix domain-containing protein n=1 Tax=Shewanella sp. Isolate11 TaxID=2908530 RepID=UPI001EFECF8C|nr:PepSY-associated TM helix domain-containing protein [Shewanella sp. Isolate11]MCG9698430.1 PepSY domain-containing protein [Shewanella sp. Isolate11]
MTDSIRSKAKALLSLHSWSGIVLGMLLYAVIFTGSVAVVSDEIGEWSNSNAHQNLMLSSDMDATIALLTEQTPEEYRDEITVYEGHRQQLVYFFHTHKQNPSGDMDDYGIQYQVSPHGEIVQQVEGFGSEIYAQDEFNALSRFLVAIHTELHLPAPWGLILTGILGLSMLIAAVSGFLIHRNLFTDLFTIRKQRDGKALKRDSHTVAGTWSIPFAILLAFTGSYFSFATAFGLPAMAMVAFGGDQEAMMHTLVGEAPNLSMTSLPSANLDLMVGDAVQRQSAAPAFITLSHWGTESANMVAFFMPSAGKVGFDQLVYNGSNGHFVEYKPLVGTVPSAGSAILSLIYPIHFGTFAGLFSKIIWVSLGVAACYVTITGMQLYAVRHERYDSSWQWLSRFNVWGFFGLPLCSLTSAIGFFVSGAMGASQSSWTPIAFVIAAVLISILTLMIRNIHFLKQLILGFNGLFCLVLPLLRFAHSDVGLLQALKQGMTELMFVDLALVVIALWCFYGIFKGEKFHQAQRIQPESSPLQVAEVVR